MLLESFCKAATLHWFDSCGQCGTLPWITKGPFAVKYETGEAPSCIMVLGSSMRSIPGVMWTYDSCFLKLPCVHLLVKIIIDCGLRPLVYFIDRGPGHGATLHFQGLPPAPQKVSFWLEMATFMSKVWIHVRCLTSKTDVDALNSLFLVSIPVHLMVIQPLKVKKKTSVFFVKAPPVFEAFSTQWLRQLWPPFLFFVLVHFILNWSLQSQVQGEGLPAAEDGLSTKTRRAGGRAWRYAGGGWGKASGVI